MTMTMQNDFEKLRAMVLQLAQRVAPHLKPEEMALLEEARHLLLKTDPIKQFVERAVIYRKDI